MQDRDGDPLRKRTGEAAAHGDAGESAAAPQLPLYRLAGSGGENGLPAPDLTFAGYVETHDRVPAFEGSDGLPYTVDVDTERTSDPTRPWAAFLVFVRWAETGAGIMGHVLSEDVAWGGTEEEARLGALDLTMFELKTELDRAIRRRADLLEE